MTIEHLYVANLIRDAFQGVVLGNGIGLLQAEAMGDYANDETLASIRTEDETEDWSRITSSALIECPNSLAFFDNEGIRFHIPAFIIANLEGKLTDHDLLFNLTYCKNDNMSRFSLLNQQQKFAVQQFLILCNKENKYNSILKPMFQMSLIHFWNNME